MSNKDKYQNVRKNLDIVLEYHNSPLVFWLHPYQWRRWA